MEGSIKSSNAFYLRYLDKETIEGMEELMDNDSEIILDLLETFLETSIQLINDLEVAVNNNNGKSIREFAHSLKSSNAQIGAFPFSTLCQKMEDMGKHNTLENSMDMLILIKQEFINVENAVKSWQNHHSPS